MGEAGTRTRGRTAAASREDVLATARARFWRGDRIDVRAIATELGLGRATLYRWFGSREALIGEVLIGEAEQLVAAARKQARGKGADRLLNTFDIINRGLAGAPPLRRFVEQEPEAAARVITSSTGIVQPRFVAMIAGLIEEERAAGRFASPIDPELLAYAIVRLGEAFMYSDAAAGMRGDVDRLRDVEALLLGVSPAS